MVESVIQIDLFARLVEFAATTQFQKRELALPKKTNGQSCGNRKVKTRTLENDKDAAPTSCWPSLGAPPATNIKELIRAFANRKRESLRNS